MQTELPHQHDSTTQVTICRPPGDRSQRKSVRTFALPPGFVLYGQWVYTENRIAESRKLAFDWDGANIAHIARHAITPAEAEEVVSGASLPLETEERAGEERHAELGATARGRLLIVAWTWRRRKIRVVTAFPANRKWRALWRRLKEGETDA